MLGLRNGIEDAAAENFSPIALLSFSSMDWGVTGRVGSFKEALADASTWAIRPLERAEEEAVDEIDEEEEEENVEEEEDEEVQPSLAYMLPQDEVSLPSMWKEELGKRCVVLYYLLLRMLDCMLSSIEDLFRLFLEKISPTLNQQQQKIKDFLEFQIPILIPSAFEDVKCTAT